MVSTDKQTNTPTDRQTDKLTNATKNITSFAKEVKIAEMFCFHLVLVMFSEFQLHFFTITRRKFPDFLIIVLNQYLKLYFSNQYFVPLIKNRYQHSVTLDNKVNRIFSEHLEPRSILICCNMEARGIS